MNFIFIPLIILATFFCSFLFTNKRKTNGYTVYMYTFGIINNNKQKKTSEELCLMPAVMWSATFSWEQLINVMKWVWKRMDLTYELLSRTYLHIYMNTLYICIYTFCFLFNFFFQEKEIEIWGAKFKNDKNTE